MSPRKPNPSAFPWFEDHPIHGSRGEAGMSLRDWFAGQALAGLLADDRETPACVSRGPEGIEQERKAFACNVAKAAYRFADAMLAARVKEVQS